jgi:hypothetical protein
VGCDVLLLLLSCFWGNADALLGGQVGSATPRREERAEEERDREREVQQLRVENRMMWILKDENEVLTRRVQVSGGR